MFCTIMHVKGFHVFCTMNIVLLDAGAAASQVYKCRVFQIHHIAPTKAGQSFVTGVLHTSIGQ